GEHRAVPGLDRGGGVGLGGEPGALRQPHEPVLRRVRRGRGRPVLDAGLRAAPLRRAWRGAAGGSAGYLPAPRPPLHAPPPLLLSPLLVVAPPAAAREGPRHRRRVGGAVVGG